MNSQQMQHLQAGFEAWNLFFNLGALLIVVTTLASIVSWILSVFMLWGIVKNDRGIDRLFWAGLVLIPILGPLLYIAHYSAEKEGDWVKAHSAKP